jgi:YggT family protein
MPAILQLLDTFVQILFTVLVWSIIIRALLSWFNFSPSHPVHTFLRDITEPILEPLRRVVPRIGMIDITPIVAIILLAWVIEPILRMVIRSMAGV